MSAIETRAATVRGFACVGLVQPKTAANIGAVDRGAAQMVTGGAAQRVRAGMAAWAREAGR